MKKLSILLTVLLIFSLLIPTITFADGSEKEDAVNISKTGEQAEKSLSPTVNDKKSNELDEETESSEGDRENSKTVNDSEPGKGESEDKDVNESSDKTVNGTEKTSGDEKQQDSLHTDDDELNSQIRDQKSTSNQKQKDGKVDEENRVNLQKDKKRDVKLQQDIQGKKKEKGNKKDTEDKKQVKKESSKVSTFSAPAIKKTETSKLGQIYKPNVKIYKELGELDSAVKTGSNRTNKVYFIKKQGEVNNSLYYLISNKPSSTEGVVGWVKSSDIKTYSHVGVDSKSKTFYFRDKNNINIYDNAWGGVKDRLYHDANNLRNQKFEVNLTEKVGQDNIWYRGRFNGATKDVWVHESHLTIENPVVIENVKKTSRLGQIYDSEVNIYRTLGESASAVKTGSSRTNKVYFIKKQGEVNNSLYYLISNKPSSTEGVVGWVKSSDIKTYSHVGVDSKSKTFYFRDKNNINIYDNAWGGVKDRLYHDADNLRNQKFEVNLTEKVGQDNIWYRGRFNGETKDVWVHESHLTTENPVVIENVKKTSRLGQIYDSEVNIYRTLGKSASAMKTGSSRTNKVYFIKKQGEVNNSLYYLISNKPSSTEGVVGWVKSSDIKTYSHAGVDSKSKTFYFKDKNNINIYDNAWGGVKDRLYHDADNLRGKKLEVNLTEKVGQNNIWYRGRFNGATKDVWVHESHLLKYREPVVEYSNYDITLNEALNIQMGIENPPPQTDLYRNDPAYIHSDYVTVTSSAIISGSGVNIRTSPEFENNVAFNVDYGTEITIKDEVKGDRWQGSTKWYKIKYKNQGLFVHADLVNPNKQVATTTADLNVRAMAKIPSHIYGVLNEGTTVTIIGNDGEWYKIPYQKWRNAKRADTRRYLNPNKYDIFQHLNLGTSTKATASELNDFLNGKGVLEGTGQAFINGGEKYAVNELYLISHALHETNNGASDLATGTKVGKDRNGNATMVTSKNKDDLTKIRTVYNMFGVGANDGAALEMGSEKAYKEGWFTPEAAIIGGAKFIGEDYIHSKYNQNTLYKMRWNPIAMDNGGFAHQYATDIGWAVKQVETLKAMYEFVSNPLLQFDIVNYS
ncbi:hypothetical protein GCM10009001_22680 [Virgibacillus siamensis]|uniref:SH3b domain-containing protein n=1 Tax=Virgibacillus siamensis TaxID=480071 RepID=A0ABP3R7F8_9BACI